MSEEIKRQMTEQEEMDYEMRPEYDISKAVRNPYAERANQETNLVVIEPELYEVFSSSDAVNDALRLIVRVSTKAMKQAKAS